MCFAEYLNFTSDIYALQSVLDDYGYSDGMVKVPSEDGHLLDTETLIDMMDASTALILLPSVLYRSGQVLEMQKITEAAHGRGIIGGFALSPSTRPAPRPPTASAA